ncbi:FtsX-like permease family protein, partial [Thermococcus sp.]|uniref:ABC transporter permease n=1 Tax=Thermococcus sp. TaxID=35749 RepID=UPI00261E1253
MRLKATLRKLRGEKKKAAAVFIVFFVVSLGFNFTLSAVGSIGKAVEDFAETGNVEFVVSGISVENLTRFGEVVNYIYFKETEVTLNGKSYEAMAGYGEFRSLGVKSPDKGVVVLAFPEADKGDRLIIDGEEYEVRGSYYYLSGEPIVLTKRKGTQLYAFMKCSDPEALAEFLMKNARVEYFADYSNGIPYMDSVKGVKDFAMSFLYLLLGAALTVIVVLTAVHAKGSVRDIGTMKALGLPDSFTAALFIGDHLLVAMIAYLAGIPIGMKTGYSYIAARFPIPFSPDYAYPLKFDAVMALAIALVLSLPYLYISRIRPVNALRFTPRKSSPLRFFAVFFVIFLAASSAYFGIRGVENLANSDIPFNVMVVGPPEKIAEVPGEKAGYLSGQSAGGITTEVYFLDYGSTFKSTLIGGRWFQKPDEAVIGKGLAKKLGIKVGDTVELKLLGKPEEYVVTGISDAPFYDFKAVFLPKKPFVQDRIAFLNVSNPKAAKEEYEKLGLRVITEEDMKRKMENNIRLFRSAVYGIIGMVTLVGILALFALVYFEIESNERVYAALKALGIPNSHVWR